MIYVFIETFVEPQILDTNKAKVYYSVVSTYSQNGTIGILQYHIGKLQENNSMYEEKIDSAYIKAFEQIRNIVEYEIPKLLWLFESLFQQSSGPLNTHTASNLPELPCSSSDLSDDTLYHHPK